MDLFNTVYNIFFSSWYIYLIFGMVFGSFLNVVIYRVPNGLSIVSPSSSCPKCGNVIKWYDNIPVFSWIILKGKCRKCNQPISVEYPAVELITGLLTLGLFLYTGPMLKLIILIPLAYTLLCITIIDFKTYSIPYGLNITLFIIGLAAVLLHIMTDNILNITWQYSLLGAFSGFALLFLIQIIGKLIYKQDAMGGGDLLLLGASGLVLGPKLTLTAFILGSITAVISYSIPSFINFIKKKEQAEKFLKLAEKYEKELDLSSPDDQVEILGLKMQLFNNLNLPEEKLLREKLSDLYENGKLNNISLIRIFFRFMAIDDKYDAESIVKLIKHSDLNIINNIRQVVHEDLIGYDSASDNLELLKNYALPELKLLIEENKKSILAQIKFITLTDIKENYSNLSEIKDKKEFILKYNRLYQLNGYTAEQNLISDLATDLLSDSDTKTKLEILSEMALVYYKDFYFEHSIKLYDNIEDIMTSGHIEKSAVRSFYNAALFRIFFYRQRLAFGPYLAIGIMLSVLFGEKIIQIYINFIKNILT